MAREQIGGQLPDPAERLHVAWPGSVSTLFEQQVQQTPQRTAVVDQFDHLSYQQLQRRSTLIAEQLSARGVGAEDIVAIFAHRSVAVVAAVLGVLRSGAAFLLLDPAYPPARILSLINLSRPKAWLQLVDAGPLPEALEHGLNKLDLRSKVNLARGGLIESTTTHKPLDAAPVAQDQLAYVSFTSGSTGQPKGVLGRHGPLSCFIEWQKRQFNLNSDDRFSLLSGLSHDPLQRDIFTPLCIGASIWIPDPNQLYIPGWLAQWCRANAITQMHTTPAMLRFLCDAPVDSTPTLPELRGTYVVGDVLANADARLLRTIAPNADCVNLYGATETQRAVAYHRVSADKSKASSTVPLGIGIPGVQLVVLDENHRRVGVGDVGEIHVRSHALARGYLGDRELTAAKFVTNPFTGDSEDRLYKTGDLGRYRADGSVEFAGRKDDQVQIRGVRVEPGEVQVVLSEHQLLARCAVIAVGSAPDCRLVAWCVPTNKERPPSESDLRAYLHQNLPPALIPDRLLTTDALPLTPNNKLDRAMLKRWSCDAQSTPSADTPTTNRALSKTEDTIADMWSRILTAGPFAADDDFFQSGGDSLRVMQLLAMLMKHYQIQLGAADIFEHSTVRAMARQIKASTQKTAPQGPAPTTLLRQSWPLSRAQQALWYEQQTNPDSAAYNLGLALDLNGELNVDALQRALDALIVRHPLLRCRVEIDDCEPVFKLTPPDPGLLQTVDLTDQPTAVWKGQMLAFVQQPFDLHQDQLVRAMLMRLSKDRWVLAISTHHLVSDGWSQSVLRQDLIALYRAQINLGPTLPPLRFQFADYDAWQREQMQGEQRDQHLQYWTNQLSALLPCRLPSDQPDRTQPRHLGAQLPLKISPRRTSQLRRLAQTSNATLFQTLLTVLMIELARATGQQDVVVGTDIANRTCPNSDELIGLLVNQLVLRHTIEPSISFADTLRRVRQTAIDAYARPWLPFADLVGALNPKRVAGRNPLFQIMFVQQEPPPQQIQLDRLAITPKALSVPSAPFDLSVHFWLDGEKISGFLLYRTDLYSPTAMGRFRDSWMTTLDQLAAHSTRPLGELPHYRAAQATAASSQALGDTRKQLFGRIRRKAVGQEAV
ncbi:MAG: hypothetical protein DHS20C11_31970 [Lysobacteraceae bacterium]|nr:MAG: hypothetical protein DHS20C11_31970 [Xanthomonadaceae bacterium]